jgi:hypothetical protein
MPVMISVLIDTDDDAEIVFEGKSYCYYRDDLKISRVFDTVEECYAFLRNEIKITPNQKVSECLHRWIEEFITYHKAGEDWQGIHCNQTVEIWIDDYIPTPAIVPTPTMRTLVQKTIADNWIAGCDEMTNVAHTMGWTRGELDSWTHTEIGPWTLEFKHDTKDFRECLAACSDEALLAWLQAQHCQIYR